ncbi:MAG: EAL domain-containing protein [Ruminococcus sp.]|nr:EAL domain-containing protein [Ruminococcus sp.]
MAVGSDIWNRIFGEGWQAYSELAPDIGLFLIDHISRNVDTDENALKILNVREQPEYDKMNVIVSQLAEYNSSSSRVMLRTVEKTDEITAGILKLQKTEVHTREEEIILPVFPQSRLVAAMLENTAPSLFALIQLEERDRMTLNGAQIYAALSAIISSAPKDTMISEQSRTRFWLYIPNFSGDEIEFLSQLQSVVEKCSTDRDPEVDPDNKYSLTFSAGCGAVSTIPAQRMHTAEYTLYEAVSNGVGSIALYSMEKYESQKSEYAGIRKFLHLIDNNLFSYHFQPIVDVRTGDVVAYEALMRTDKSIGMRPVEVLGYAAQLKRLYDVEKLTMRNTLEAVYRHQDALHSRRLFINSIPAHMLSDEDWAELETQYGELMEKLCIELTEQSEPSEKMLEMVHRRIDRNHMQLAIDDYGTGYSNTSNLVKYKPNVVKIDRALIEDINTKPKMQRLVAGLIEFMHENGYSALAEGVETYEEMRTMIKLGSDLLQGFYVSRPKPIMTYEIASKIKEEIIKINLEFSSDVTRSYHPKNGETVDLIELATNRYNTVFIETDDVTLVGERDKLVNLNIIFKDGLRTKTVFRNVFLCSERTDAIVSLGEDSEVEMVIEGSNEFLCRGISVPMSATLKMTGIGSLHIRAEMTNSFAIGCDSEHSPGNIMFDISGELSIETSGETAVGIGGGRNDGRTSIVVRGGTYNLSGSGTAVVLLGNFYGGSRLDIAECSLNLDISSTNGIGIGSISGDTRISVRNYNIGANMRGSNLCAIGVGSGGTGGVSITSGRFNANMHGSNLKCIGTFNGKLDCDIHLSQITLECEGRYAAGIGDLEGSGNITIDQCGIKCHMLSSNYIDFGTRGGVLSVDGTDQDVMIND